MAEERQHRRWEEGQNKTITTEKSQNKAIPAEIPKISITFPFREGQQNNSN